MLQEEDQEVYGPQYGALKQDYQAGINALKTGNTVPPKKNISIAQEGAK